MLTRDDFRRLMGSFAAGVTVVTTVDERGHPHALTATAFASLSAEPPLCLVCVDRTARAHQPLLATRCFAVNLLARHQRAESEHFATKEEDKFAAVSHTPGPLTGCPLLPGVVAHAECAVEAVYPGGDHDIFVGRLLGGAVSEVEPLVYWRGRYATVAQH